jgi:hypothetical protein
VTSNPISATSIGAIPNSQSPSVLFPPDFSSSHLTSSSMEVAPVPPTVSSSRTPVTNRFSSPKNSLSSHPISSPYHDRLIGINDNNTLSNTSKEDHLEREGSVENGPSGMLIPDEDHFNQTLLSEVYDFF